MVLELSWNDFLQVYGTMNQSEMYGVVYPEFEAAVDAADDFDGFMLFFVKRALEVEKVPLRQVMNTYVECLLENFHYAFDGDESTVIIRHLMEKGAVLPGRTILGPNIVDGVHRFSGEEFDVNDEDSHEDMMYCEFQNYNAKGGIIDACKGDMPYLDKVDWKKVIARDWNEMELSSEPLTESLRHSVIKFQSKYLLKTYPHEDDEKSYGEADEYEDEE